MARIRTMKPDFFRSHEIYAAELRANQGRQPANYLNLRAAFLGLVTASDREGRFKWRPAELKLDCLPYDAVDFAEVLDILAGTGEPPLVRRYEVAGAAYGVVTGFRKHQRPKQDEAQSVLPPPDWEPGADRTPIGGQSAEGKEGKGKEGEGTELFAPSPSDSAPAILEYPCVGKGDKVWRLTQTHVDALKSDYPHLDVLGECRKAHAWAVANAAKRKTARGMPAFLANWLARATDGYRGGASGVRPTAAGAAAPVAGKYDR